MNHEEIVELSEQVAKTIYDKIITRLSYEDEQNIPEALAIRLIDALEWTSESPEIAKCAASTLCDDYELPRGCSAYLKKHFDLAY